MPKSYNEYYLELEETISMINQRQASTWFTKWNIMRGLSEYKKIHNPTKLNKPLFIHLLNRKSEIVSNRLRLTSNHLNYYLHKIGKAENPLCTLCNVIENTEHFLTNCIKTKPLLEKLKILTKETNKDLTPLILNNKTLLQETILYIKTNSITI